MTIRLALRQLNGTGDVSWDQDARTLAIQYQPGEVSIPAVQEALAGAGYMTTVVGLSPTRRGSTRRSRGRAARD